MLIQFYLRVVFSAMANPNRHGDCTRWPLSALSAHLLSKNVTVVGGSERR